MSAGLRFELKVTVTEEDGQANSFEESAEMPTWMLNSEKTKDYVALVICELAMRVGDKM